MQYDDSLQGEHDYGIRQEELVQVEEQQHQRRFESIQETRQERQILLPEVWAVGTA